MLDTPSRRAFLIGVLSCGAMSAAVTYFRPGGKPAPQVRLRLLTGSDSTGGRKLLFEMWNEANPDTPVDVVVAEGPTGDQKRQMLDAAVNGTYDLLNLDIINIQEFAAQGLISRIALGKDAFLTPTLDAGKANDGSGQYWAAPFNTDVGMLFERIPADGAPAENPSLSTVVDGLAPGSQELICQLGPGSSASDEAFVVNVLEHALSRDRDILSTAGVPVMDDLGRWQRALAPVRDAIATRRIRAVDSESTSLTAFTTGPRPRYMRGWPVQYRMLQENNDPDVIAGRVRVHPLPIGILGGQSLALVAKSRHHAHARALINFLTGDQAQKVLAAHGLAPTRVAAYSDPKLRAFIPHLEAIRQAVENARPRPVHRNYAEFAAAVVRHMRPLLTDGAELPSMFIDALRSALPDPPA